MKRAYCRQPECGKEIEDAGDGWAHVFSGQQQCADGAPERAAPPLPEFLMHVAGTYDEQLGQLCSRCGFVLDEGSAGKCYEVGSAPPAGWTPGSRVLVSAPGWNPQTSVSESVLDGGRDRSDEAECDEVAYCEADDCSALEGHDSDHVYPTR